MSSSFLRLHRLRADPRLRRWGPALLAALVCQLLVVVVMPPAGPEVRRGRRVAVADDTPTLLRWSRTSEATPAANLQAIPLQGLTALPPPPPSTLPNGGFARAPRPARVHRPARGPVAAAELVKAGGAGLPPLPGEVFRLARLVAHDQRPQQPSAALVAVQRRQWWLFSGQDKALQALWDGGQEQAPPAAFGPVPDGVAVRQVAASAAVPLAFAALHGRSLLDRDQLWLLWLQGPKLWILRGPLESSPAPLTKP